MSAIIIPFRYLILQCAYAFDLGFNHLVSFQKEARLAMYAAQAVMMSPIVSVKW